MRHDDLRVSLDTLIAASPLLGHELEDRGSISNRQDSALAESLLGDTAVPLRDFSQRGLFLVAPLDILVSEQQGQKQFHLLELNGTGIGGLSNLPADVVGAILHSLAETAATVDDPAGVLLLAVSGKESDSSPRRNRLMHEKLLFLEAMRRGLAHKFGECAVRNIDQLAAGASDGPTAAIGYIKDFLRQLERDDAGALWLRGRPVAGLVNDRFCSNVLSQFQGEVDLGRLLTLNRCFAAGGDKGVAYSLMNSYLQRRRPAAAPPRMQFAHAPCRLSLIETVLDWLAAGRQVVIKPHGAGLGHGIEFFFDPREPLDRVVARIDQSLAQTAEFYARPGGALPYTVCEYVDAEQIQDPTHPLVGHKYELRVVVYRDNDELKAFPSIAKVARERCEPAGNGDGAYTRRALINNITASGDTDKVNGVDYMLPLCNWRTLRLLGLTSADLRQLCALATGYVRHVLDEVEDAPSRFGLPSGVRSRPAATTALPVAA